VSACSAKRSALGTKVEICCVSAWGGTPVALDEGCGFAYV